MTQSTPNRKYLDALLRKMTDIESIGTSSYVPRDIIEPIELELMLGDVYDLKTPAGFPSSEGERLGFRRLNYPVNGTYEDMKFRLGVTTLHVKPKNSEKNLNSVAIF